MLEGLVPPSYLTGIFSNMMPRATMKSPPRSTSISVPAPEKKMKTSNRQDMKFLNEVFSAKVLLPSFLGPPTTHPKNAPIKTNDIAANKAWVPPICPMSLYRLTMT